MRASGQEYRAVGVEENFVWDCGWRGGVLVESQAVSGYSEASMAASAMSSIAALDAVGSDAMSSWLRRAWRRDDVLDGGREVAEVDEVGAGLGPRILFGFFEQCDER